MEGEESELFVFRSTIVSYCPSPSAFLLPLFRACSFRREGMRTSFPRRVDGFRSISRVVAKSRFPVGMGRESKENCLKRNPVRKILSFYSKRLSRAKSK